MFLLGHVFVLMTHTATVYGLQLIFGCPCSNPTYLLKRTLIALTYKGLAPLFILTKLKEPYRLRIGAYSFKCRLCIIKPHKYSIKLLFCLIQSFKLLRYLHKLCSPIQSKNSLYFHLLTLSSCLP